MKSLEWLVDQLNQKALASGYAQGSRCGTKRLKATTEAECAAAFAIVERIDAIRAAAGPDANQKLLELLDGDGS
jgi:hypothetical protein